MTTVTRWQHMETTVTLDRQQVRLDWIKALGKNLTARLGGGEPVDGVELDLAEPMEVAAQEGDGRGDS
uniref:DUF834 domain-containing protein n=1 Tax=Oryza sativa subsp. japonica TaxID=39947 RepID=Q69IW5_ORYSJ|nr:hypothetical protein [Oryza sativa Japonica Group]